MQERERERERESERAHLMVAEIASAVVFVRLPSPQLAFLPQFSSFYEPASCWISLRWSDLIT